MEILTEAETINYLTQKLLAGRVGFLTGAGISGNSGIPLANSLLHAIFKRLDLDEELINMLMKSGYPFEGFMQVFSANTKCEKLYNIFDCDIPNRNHYFISAMATTYGNGIIVTTNFDTLTEKAFPAEIEVKRVLYPFTDTPLPGPTVIKLHGCITDPKNMSITLSGVAYEEGGKRIEKVLREVLCSDHIDTLLVLGYSCSDVFDINPALESIQTDKCIVFIQYAPGEGVKVEEISGATEKNPFRAGKGWRITTDVDILISELASRTGILLPENRVAVSKWEEQLDDWLSSYENDKGRLLSVQAQLFSGIGKMELAIQLQKKGLDFYQQENNPVYYYKKLQDLGLYYLYHKELEEAKKCLETAIAYYGSRPKPFFEEDLCIAINNLGGVYHQLGLYKEAENAFYHSIKIAEDLGAEQYFGKRTGNLAGVYLDMGRINDAKLCCDEAARLARKFGDKHLESNMMILQNKIAHFANQRPTRQNIAEGRKWKNELGNSEEKIAAILTEAETLTRINECTQAISLLESIDINSVRLEQRFWILSKLSNCHGNLKALGNVEKLNAELEQIVTGNEISVSARAAFYGNKAQEAFIKKEYEHALQYNAKAFELYEAEGNEEGQLICLMQIAELRLAQEEYDAMNNVLKMALTLANKINNQSWEIRILNRIGDYYNRVCNDRQALLFFQKAYSISEMTHDESMMAQMLYSIALTHYNLFDSYAAEDAFRHALELAEKNSMTDLARKIRRFAGLQ